MCGIAGIIGFDGSPVHLEEMKRMCAAMRHRGPNDDGFYLRAGVGLGMRRLSIIDLSTGRQPVRNEDGTVWTVFNGEIYNFRELRRDLEARGHQFYTTTDTEVIVHLYEEYGERCVEHMRGMFAFAVWDENRRKLLLARDRVGVKPLYYAQIDSRLVFGSELKVLLQLPGVRRSLNWNAVNHLFTYLCTSHTESIIEGVRKLDAGHILVAEAGKDIRISRYWDVDFEPDYSHDEAWFIERLRALLEESVRLRLVSDVPLGAFLSGGIDSSSVVAMMSRLMPEPVKTFSIGFSEQDYDELRYARKVARTFGTDHHELVIDTNVLEVIDDLAWYLDEPFGDSSAIPTYMVSKLAAGFVTVVLSGDGGDELFAGYDRYLVEERERRFRYIPSLLRRGLGAAARLIPEGVKGRNFLRHLSFDGPERYLDASTLFRTEGKAKLFRPDVFRLIEGRDAWRAEREFLDRVNGHWLSSVQYCDIRSYLPLDILTKVDRMSMAHSLEAREPLLDHKLLEFAATVPPELRLKNGATKYIFKQAMRGILPEEIVDRRKQGFAIPLGRWFRGRLDGFVRDLLLSDRAVQRGIFNPAYIEQILEMHKRGRKMDLQLWTLISFELWCRRFLDSHGEDVAGGAAADAAGTGRAAGVRSAPVVLRPVA